MNMTKVTLREAIHDMSNRGLTFRYRCMQFQEPVRNLLLRIGVIKPLSDEDNKKLLAYVTWKFLNGKEMNIIQLNLMMFKFYRRMRWRVDVRLPYYWGPLGIHVLYGVFTNSVRANSDYYAIQEDLWSDSY